MSLDGVKQCRHSHPYPDPILPAHSLIPLLLLPFRSPESQSLLQSLPSFLLE